MSVQYLSDEYLEQKAKVKHKANIVRSRMYRLEKSGYASLSPSLDYLKRATNGGRFGMKGKNMRELQDMEKMLDQFIQKETSTITGMKEHVNEMASMLGITEIRKGDAKKIKDTFIKLKSEANKLMEYCNLVDSQKYMNYRETMQDIKTMVRQVREGATMTVDDLEDALVEVSKLVELDMIENGGEGYFVNGAFAEYFPDI